MSKNGKDRWRISPLGDVVDVLDSRRVPVNGEERVRRRGDVPYYGATGQVGWIDDHLFEEELVLLGEDGAPFLDPARPKAYLIRGKSWVNNHAHVLRARPGLLNSFLMHQLNGLDYRPYVSGTTRLKLPQGPMRQMLLLIPSLDEQIQIVAEIEAQLTRLDAGVAALKRAQANLKRYRAAVLKAACEGKLVPTEAELARAEGRIYESGAALLERILAERRAKWNGRGKYKEPAAPDVAGLPELPEGWCWASLEQLSWSSSYGTSAKCTYETSGPPVLRIPNIESGRVDLSDLKFANTEDPIKPGDELLPGDLLIIRTNGSINLIGRAALIRDKMDRQFGFASYLIRYRILGMSILAEWLAGIWDCSLVRDWIEVQAATSAGQHNISLSVLNALLIPLPPPAEQQRIVAEVKRCLSVIEEIAAMVAVNLKRAAWLRHAALSRAFSDQL